MNVHMDLKENSYDILVERGILNRAGEILNLKRRVLVVTDSGFLTFMPRQLQSNVKNPSYVLLS